MGTIAFTSEGDTGPQTVTEEELFCDYLAARLQQALEALDEARNELVGKPQDLGRAADVMRRVHELRDLKKQLELQRQRVNLARAAAGLEPLVREAETSATVEFRTVQTEQAAKIMAALAASPRTCPSCQSPVLKEAEQCSCMSTPAVAEPRYTSTSPHEPLP